jgi:hypothetical protein
MAHAMGAQRAAERLYSMRERIEQENTGKVSRASAIFGANLAQYNAAGALLARIQDIPAEVAEVQKKLGLDQEGVERQTRVKLSSIAKDTRETLGLTFDVSPTPAIGAVGLAPSQGVVNEDLLVAYLQGFQSSCIHPGSREFVSGYDVACATVSGRGLKNINNGRYDAYPEGLHEAAEAVRCRIQSNSAVDAAYASNLVTIYKDELEEAARNFVAPGHPRVNDVVLGMQFAAFRAAGRSIEAKRMAGVVDDPENMPEVAPSVVEQVKKEAGILDDYVAAGASLLTATDRESFEAAKTHFKDAFLALPETLQEALLLSPKPMDPGTLMERAAASQNAVEDYKVRFLLAPEMKPQLGFAPACTPGSNTIMIRGEGGQAVLAQADQAGKNLRIYELDPFGNPVRFRQDGKDTWRIEEAPRLTPEALTYLSLVSSKDNVNHFLNNALAAKNGITPVEISSRPVDRYFQAPVVSGRDRIELVDDVVREVVI